MNTNDAAATLITYLLCCETVTRGLTRFVIHHCTYEGTEIVRRETRPIDSLGSIPLGSSESCPHTFAGGSTACSHDLPLLWLSLSHWLDMRVNSSAHDLTSSKVTPTAGMIRMTKRPYEPCCRQTIDTNGMLMEPVAVGPLQYMSPRLRRPCCARRVT